MNPLQMRSATYSPDDEATIKRWRRLVCVFYGAISLALVAAEGGQQFVNHRYGGQARIAGSSAPILTSRIQPNRDKRLGMNGPLSGEDALVQGETLRSHLSEQRPECLPRC